MNKKEEIQRLIKREIERTLREKIKEEIQEKTRIEFEKHKDEFLELLKKKDKKEKE